MSTFEPDVLAEDTSPESRLRALGRALKNADDVTRKKLEDEIRLIEQELAHRSEAPERATTDWRSHLELLRQELEDQATIFSDVTVTGKELPGVAGVLPAAARFLAARHHAHDAIFHPKSAVAAPFKVETLSGLLDVIAEHPRVAILGEPGAGKSTTMVALAHALAVRSLIELESGGPACIPIFVELGGMSGEPFEGYVMRLLSSSGRSIDPEFFRSGKTMLFLDGLNEVAPDDASRVRQWLEVHPSARVVVSCRRIDYVDRDLPLRRIEIQPLDPGQIYGFLRKYISPRDAERLFWALAGSEAANCWRWYKRDTANPSFDDFWFGSVGPAESYEVEKQRLAALQKASKSGTELPGMLSVVSSPMLLLAAILLFIGNSSLPTRREALIEELALSLLKRVDIQRLDPGHGLPGGRAAVQAAVEETVAGIAYRMLKEAHGTGVPVPWVRSVVEDVTRTVSGDALVFELERAGLLESYGGGAQRILKFRHQLLQEYFASVVLDGEINDGLRPSDFWESVPQRMPTAWDEVVLLVAGRSKDPNEVIRWIADGNPSLAVRAADVCAERCDPVLVDTLLQGKLGVAPCPLGRARWWRRQADRDSRPGVRCRPDGLPDLTWQRVPAGKFQLGDAAVPRDLGIAVVEDFRLEIPYDYALTRYQVTRSQFASFISRAYADPTHWSSLGFTWRGNQTEPRYWNDPDFGGIANQPVVGVTWFEADAFARWINHLISVEPSLRPGWMDGQWEVSLPLVCEWEYAARYPDGRRYPWGNDYVAGSANIDERFEDSVVGPYFLQRPTPVGLYDSGVSELGIHDMCGNVWEWCASIWAPGYEFPERTEVTAVAHRSVRGGSWYNSVVYAASGCHDCHDMDLGVNDVGFRLAARPLGAEPGRVP